MQTSVKQVRVVVLLIKAVFFFFFEVLVAVRVVGS